MPAGRDRYSHNKDKDLEPFLEQLWIDRTYNWRMKINVAKVLKLGKK